jgi:hypothetical protein
MGVNMAFGPLTVMSSTYHSGPIDQHRLSLQNVTIERIQRKPLVLVYQGQMYWCTKSGCTGALRVDATRVLRAECNVLYQARCIRRTACPIPSNRLLA